MSRLNPLLIRLLTIILFACAFSKGLINVFSNPPWQSADEPMHLEAALVTGQSIPDFFPPEENTFPQFQKAILQVMSDHRFFDRLGIPEPIPLPDTFRETVFLRDAPSKLGRQPLYYIISGLPLRWFTDGVLEALYFARLINLFFALTAMAILYITLRRLYPQSPGTWVTGLFLLVCQPAFWHLGASMNPESWKFMLVSTGFLLLTFCRDSTKRSLIALFFVLWMLCVATTSWTLFPHVVIILAGSILLSRERRQSHFRWLVILPGTILSLCAAFYLSDSKLLMHEFKHVTSGIIRFASGQLDIIQAMNMLFRSFWTGFGWLNVPVPAISGFFFFILSAVILIGLIKSGSILCSKTKSDPILIVVFVSIAVGFCLVFIRCVSAEASVQGRYLFPMFPALLIGSSRGLMLLGCTFHLKRLMLATMIIVGIAGDLTSNCLGWFRFQHEGYQALQDSVRSFSVMEWVNSPGTRHVLDSRNPHSIPFFYSGWYPAEPGNTHRWMMHEAQIALPLIFSQNAFMRIEMHAFSGSGFEHRNLTLRLNNEIICQCEVNPGWETYSFKVRQETWLQGVNILKFSVPDAASPRDIGMNSDGRFLSIAVRRIDIFPQMMTGGIDELQSGWYFTPDMNAILSLAPGDGFRIRDSEPGDQIYSVSTEGLRHRNWLLTGDEIEIDGLIQLVEIGFRRACENRAVEFFRVVGQSIGMLPGVLGDIILHLLMFLVWVLLYSFCGVLTIFGFATFLDT